jgi:monooxygenase
MDKEIRTMRSDEQAEVCIVGAGPAGLTLALLLLRSGLRVSLVERTRAFDREFRGEILQPGAMQLLDELGVLADIRRRGGYELERFEMIDNGRLCMRIEYRDLASDFNFLLSVPQRHLLEELLAQCCRYRRFNYHEGASITALERDGGRVVGIHYRQDSEERTIAASLVVGADGRYSKTRKLAEIPFNRQENFAHDVLWFRVPLPAGDPTQVRVYRSGGNPVLAYRSYPDFLQLGWTLPHGRYRELASQGFDETKRQILRAAPMYEAPIAQAIHKMSDLTLLDVFSGNAGIWTLPGLVLVGDSAHTHGPIGAQGINLAIQDAVVLHPEVIRSVSSGEDGTDDLGPYEARRRPDIEAVTVLQGRQARGMLSDNPIGNLLRPYVMRALGHTPIYAKTLNQLAFGRSPISVRSDLFESKPALV